MKKIFLILSIVLVGTACEKDITKFNDNPKSPMSGTVPAATLFTTAETSLFEQMVTTNVNRNVFRLMAQQWTETTYTDESNYDLTTRKIPDNHWYRLYVSVLNQLKEATILVNAQTTDAATKKNQLAIIEILNVYTWQVLVDTYGNIPYSEGLDYNKVNPKYDDAKTIYADLAKRLTAATANLASGDSFGDADVIYGGDISHWTKFANGLKIKLGVNLVDSDVASATALISDGMKNTFASSEDNAALNYSTSLPNTNPIWIDLIQSGRHDYVPANTIVDLMAINSDPRMSSYFTMLGGKYVGGPYAAGGNYTNFSQIGLDITKPDFQGVIMTYSEIEMYLAEAAAKGVSVAGTAATHLKNGVTASIVDWTGDAAAAATYAGTLSTATLEVVAREEYISLYNRGFEAWTAWRRTDLPKFNVPSGKTYGDIPVRFTYPVGEQTLNKDNWTAAGTAIGGDKVSTKLFWDKK